jgi:transcriptional regulator with XRE-family HTH domain
MKSGLTQVEVAGHLFWTQSQVGKMERGERIISLLECRELCRLFGVSIDEIANG